jgi:hypothetical protein
MNRLDKIKELDIRIEQIKRDLEELDEVYLKGFAPKGYGCGTSYNDYDTISGGNKELHLEDYFERKKKLEQLLDIALKARLELKSEVDVELWLKLITNIPDKVHFLRVVKGYTQAKTAEMLNISERYVQKLDKKI